MADLLSIGKSGLLANKTSLATTGHNITNVNTPGYSRQSTIQVANTPMGTGAGYIGTGTSLVDVRRIYNEFLNIQVRSTTALNADAASYLSQIGQLDSLLAGSTTGINPGLQKVFAALQTAAEDPANVPARQLVLSEAEGLAKRFNTVYDRLYEQNTFINRQLGAVGDQINELATAVAGYNDAIAIAASNGHAPNDLLDAREEAVRKLSEFVGVTVVPQDDHTFNLFIGSGQPLVVGNRAARLEVGPGIADPLRSEVQFVSGNSRQSVTSLITGGEMGGLLRYRNDVLDTSMNAIGRLALSVSDQINSQLGQGLDLNGQFGKSLFRSINDPALVEQRSLARVGNSDPNANLSVTISDTTQLTTSDYEVQFSSPTEYVVRRLSDGVQFPASPATYDITTVPAPEIDGFELSVASGTFDAGDRFLVMPTRNAGRDVRADMKNAEELAFASPLKAETSPGNSGTGTISQPSVVTRLDIYDATAQADLETSLRNAPPMRLVLGPTGGPTQTYQVVDINDNVIGTGSIVPGQNNALTINVPADPPNIPVAFDYQITISGRPAEGDNFSIAFNTNGVSDNRNALQLVNLQNKAAIGINPAAPGTTGASFSDAYGDLVERVGTLTSQARVDDEATTAVLKQATDNRNSVSGVSLDEEAANLVQFEQYYQASAQIIQVARSLFDTLINSF